MDDAIADLFARYERFFNRSIAGEPDMDALASLYAPSFIAATPAGVMAGHNDDGFREAMTKGYAYYRSIGTRAMRVRGIRIVPIDAHHCVAHVDWTAIYARAGKPDTAIDFGIGYLVQMLDGPPKVFGWVSGDEQALLKQHGIV